MAMEPCEVKLLERHIKSVSDLNQFEKDSQCILNVENTSASVFKATSYLVFRCTLLHVLKNWENPIIADVVYISNSLSVCYIVNCDNTATVCLRRHMPGVTEAEPKQKPSKRQKQFDVGLNPLFPQDATLCDMEE